MFRGLSCFKGLVTKGALGNIILYYYIYCKATFLLLCIIPKLEPSTCNQAQQIIPVYLDHLTCLDSAHLEHLTFHRLDSFCFKRQYSKAFLTSFLYLFGDTHTFLKSIAVLKIIIYIESGYPTKILRASQDGWKEYLFTK